MAFVSSRRSRETVAWCHKRGAGSAISRPKGLKRKVPKSKLPKTPQSEPVQPEGEQGVPQDSGLLVDYFGLGKKDGSAKWRDQKLEAKVAGLFKQTLELTGKAGAGLHPSDLRVIQGAEEAKERLALRLAQLRQTDPDKFEEFFSLIYDFSMEKKIEEEQAALTEGAIPGTATPPWQGAGNIWKNVVDGVLSERKHVPARFAGRFETEDGKQVIDSAQTKKAPDDVYQKYPFMGEALPKGRIEQFDDPYQAVDAKGRKKCIFCSASRLQYPLEPMNVPLLSKFLNNSGFIKPRKQTGLCKTMQARVARTIKTARTLGLFSYKGGYFEVYNPAVPPIKKKKKRGLGDPLPGEDEEEHAFGMEEEEGEDDEEEEAEYEEYVYRRRRGPDADFRGE